MLENVKAPNFWSSFKDRVLKACDDLCEKKIVGRGREGTWWSNEEVDAIARKKETCKDLYRNESEKNKVKYKNIINQTKKVVARAMIKETEKYIEKLCQKPNNIYLISHTRAKTTFLCFKRPLFCKFASKYIVIL